MTSQAEHPRYWTAIGLLLLTGQTGLYRIYLRRSGSTAVMSGALLLMIAVMLAVPSQVTAMLAVAIVIVLSAIVLADLVRMKTLVAQAHDMNAIDHATVSTSVEDKIG